MTESSNNDINVIARTITGKAYTITIDQTATVDDLKEKLSDETCIPVENISLRLICRDNAQIGDVKYPDGTIGRLLNDSKSLVGQGVVNGSVFEFMIMFKRKK